MKRVKGYTRKDGTRVPGYCRTGPRRRTGGVGVPARKVPTGKVSTPLDRIKTLI